MTTLTGPTPPELTEAPASPQPARGLRYLWYRTRSSPLTIAGAVIILLYLVVALCAPLLAPVPAEQRGNPYSPVGHEGEDVLPAPWFTTQLDPTPCTAQWPVPVVGWFNHATMQCPLGTSNHGADVYYGIVWGARISVLMGVGVTATGVVVGMILGLIAGWYGGWIDELLLRITDIFLSLPLLVLAIAVIVALHNPSLLSVGLALAVVWWPTYTRLVRGQVLAIRESQYVEAARASGLPDWYIMVRHVAPNTLSPVVVQATLDIGSVVLIAASLSFIGFTSNSPLLPEWGRLVALGQEYIATGQWWTVVFPGLAIFGFVLGFNLLGDGLRDVLDPRGAR
ncbi:MAG: peptide/nickel transport system permease protein [Thermoplasmata archaeon]|jgi:peptide/nickel transport system permease protein|nr:peptide/nickel transport system permease protein [Thermoplasmata archaeon]